MLDDGSTDNQTDEEAAAEIQDELFAIYDEMNPFEDGETIVEVTIVEVEVCEAIDDDLSLSEEDVSDEDACEADVTTSTRKKRNAGQKVFKRKGQKKRKKKANVSTSYKSRHKAAASWSYNKAERLKNKVSQRTKSKKAKKPYLSYHASLKRSENTSYKLERWMATMPNHMKELPVTLLAIPGTHDSHTYTMRKDMNSSQESPVYENVGSRVIDVFGGVKSVVDAWGRGLKPGHKTYEQLRLGLRYFDFR